jgi:AraC-like DNA-binding protein
MFAIIGLSLALFLALILVSKKEKSLADWLLAAWLLVIALHLGLYHHHTTGLKVLYPHLLGWAVPLPLLHGPFLYLYASSLTKISTSRGKYWYGHFLPAVFLYLYILPLLFSSAEEKLLVDLRGFSEDFYFQFLHKYIILLSGFVYALLSAQLLRQAFSTTNSQKTAQLELHWLRYLTICMSGIWVLVAVGNNQWVFSTASLFVLFVGYFGIKRLGIFTEKNVQLALESPYASSLLVLEPSPNRKKYQKSGLSEAQAVQIQKDLHHLLRIEKLFKNSDLSLSDLAERMGVHPNYLSQVINEREGMTFQEYLNTLRVEEFKSLAGKAYLQHYTLLALAFECGFNSKSSFNRYVKKVTGLSPSDYLKSIT